MNHSSPPEHSQAQKTFLGGPFLRPPCFALPSRGGTRWAPIRPGGPRRKQSREQLAGGGFLILKPGYHSVRGRKGSVPMSQPPAQCKCQPRKSHKMLLVGNPPTKH